jgi:hypothetical protein
MNAMTMNALRTKGLQYMGSYKVYIDDASKAFSVIQSLRRSTHLIVANDGDRFESDNGQSASDNDGVATTRRTDVLEDCRVSKIEKSDAMIDDDGVWCHVLDSCMCCSRISLSSVIVSEDCIL